MAKLIYVANVSLDGYIEDAHGGFDWTEPTDEAFAFITDLVRPVGTYLYGRRLYETMAVWEADPSLAAQSDLWAYFANVWQAADKIVYSDNGTVYLRYRTQS
jgi:dihydrofolate reductase